MTARITPKLGTMLNLSSWRLVAEERHVGRCSSGSHRILARLVVAAISVAGLTQRIEGIVAQRATTPAQGSIAGVVVDATTSAPIDGAVVSIDGGVQATTDGRGRFMLTNLAPGEFAVRAAKQGFVSAYKGARFPSDAGQPIRLDALESVNNIRVRIWQTAGLGGRVVDESNVPIVGQTVQALREHVVDGSVRFLPEEGRDAVARTDGRGEYRLAGLMPGRYLVAVTDSVRTVDRNRAIPHFSTDPGRRARHQRRSSNLVRARTNRGSILVTARSAFAVTGRVVGGDIGTRRPLDLRLVRTDAQPPTSLDASVTTSAADGSLFSRRVYRVPMRSKWLRSRRPLAGRPCGSIA